jgi:HD superfamily phosphodiesterase
MKILNEIQSAEDIYLNLLEAFFTERWGKTTLCSHGIEHHRRVWQYVKELLNYISPDLKNAESLFPEKLIIACYLHDLGMSVDPEVRHGIHSRELCRLFLLDNNLGESDFGDVLDAVEHHDDKEYKTHGVDNNEILKILSVADDLDAFGYTGIYRYLEIYIARNLRPEVIGDEIRKNALGRFQNFELKYSNFPELIEKHRKRFLILDDFFVSYNKEAGY